MRKALLHFIQPSVHLLPTGFGDKPQAQGVMVLSAIAAARSSRAGTPLAAPLAVKPGSGADRTASAQRTSAESESAAVTGPCSTGMVGLYP